MSLLIKQDLVIEDPWVKVEKIDRQITDYPWFSLLPLTALSSNEQWPLPQTWIGTWFEPQTDLALFSKAVLDLPLLSIDVQDFHDGRAFSLAIKLKRQLNYQGELRITGNFLLDQMAILKDCGIDSFSLPAGSDFEHALYILNNSPLPVFRQSRPSTGAAND